MPFQALGIRNDFGRVERSDSLKKDGIHYLDVGTSRGVWGSERGYCLMIGGEEEAAKRLEPISLWRKVDLRTSVADRQRFREGILISKLPIGGVFMPAGLRDQLIGAWKLICYEERPVDGSPSFYPMSEKPMGIIMYTPDGFMSAQLMKPDRKPFASGDWFKGTDEEYKQEASTYIAYSGPFHVDEEQKTLAHSMFVSLFPNWLGQTQPRMVRIEGDDLYLSTATPIHSQGKIVNSHLHWKRASKV